jgi:hypothetical protein
MVPEQAQIFYALAHSVPHNFNAWGHSLPATPPQASRELARLNAKATFAALDA